MRKGKVAARPSGFPDCLKARTEHREKLVNLIMSLQGLSGAQAPFGPFGQTESSLVKPSQTEKRGLTVKPRRSCEIS